MRSKDPVIFLHIPKTAGRTLEWMVLEKEYWPSESAKIDNANLERCQESLRSTDHETIRLVNGHIGYGWHRLLDRPARYITLLREPVDRVISLYFHLKRDTNHTLHEEVSKMSMREFIETGVFIEETHNGQTKLLSGALYGPPGENPLPETVGLLGIALTNLERFAVVGLTERFDESLLLMKRALGWGRHYYARQNVGRNRPPKGHVSSAERELIQAANQEDIELYSQAKSVFESKFEAAGPSLAVELRQFRRLNRLYAVLYPVIRPLRRLARLP
jgi:hypothetical protein